MPTPNKPTATVLSQLEEDTSTGAARNGKVNGNDMIDWKTTSGKNIEKSALGQNEGVCFLRSS